MRSRPTTRSKAAQAGSAVPDRERKVTPLLAMVLDAARRKCEDFDDGPAAREQMRCDVLDTPHALLADLLQALTKVRIRRADLLSPTTTTQEPNP